MHGHAYDVWTSAGPGKKLCTDHDVEFPSTRSCPQCAGPARLNLRDKDGEKIDPFPELTAALGPVMAENRIMAERYAAIAKMFTDGGESRGIQPNATAAAAMYRLEAQRVDRVHDDLRLLANWRRTAALEERRRWSERPPADAPGVGAAKSKEAEVH